MVIIYRWMVYAKIFYGEMVLFSGGMASPRIPHQLEHWLQSAQIELLILPKEMLHVVYLFMPLRPIKSGAANSNSLNTIIFAELQLVHKKY